MQVSTVEIERSSSALQVSWPQGARVVFALEDERVLGIRDVRFRGMPVRNAERLWRPVITTPAGIHYAGFRLVDVQETDGAVRIVTDAVGIHTYLQEELDEYLCDILTLPSADAPVIDRFTWELRPSELELDGRAFSGFSYRYHFAADNPARAIYRLFDDATWEIGGHVAGNTLLLQGQVNPPVTALTPEEYFTTACNYYGAEMRGVMGKPARVSMQRLPRIGTLQAFDFLAHRQGVLFTYFDPLIDVFSIVQKDAGEDMLHVLDEVRRPASPEFTTHPKHILFHPLDGELPREETRNLWTRARDFVYDRERARTGIAPSPVLPRVWIPQISKDVAHIGHDAVPRPRMLDYLADTVLPRWAEMGVKEICTFSLWVSDYTTDRLRTKDESGMHGGLTVGSICCVRTHEIDPLWGGLHGLAAFTRRAHELGIAVQLWWATHLSRRAPIYAERPDFMLLARDGLANGGGYGHQTIITLNLANPDCLEWEFNKLKAVFDATGIDGFFHDSYGNMTFLPVNYADPRRTGQQEAYERLAARLQAAGMKTFTIEGLGPFGVGHFGMNLLPKDPAARGGYQNALDWWLGQEDMMLGLNMGIGQAIWPDADPGAFEFAFRCLAAGGRFGFTQHRGPIEHWTGWLRDLNRLHARIAPVNGKRMLLPGDRGILWQQAGGSQLLFAFHPFAYPFPAGSLVAQITPGGKRRVEAVDGLLSAEPWCVYRIE